MPVVRPDRDFDSIILFIFFLNGRSRPSEQNNIAMYRLAMLVKWWPLNSWECPSASGDNNKGEEKKQRQLVGNGSMIGRRFLGNNNKKTRQSGQRGKLLLLDHCCIVVVVERVYHPLKTVHNCSARERLIFYCWC